MNLKPGSGSRSVSGYAPPGSGAGSFSGPRPPPNPQTMYTAATAPPSDHATDLTCAHRWRMMVAAVRGCCLWTAYRAGCAGSPTSRSPGPGSPSTEVGIDTTSFPRPEQVGRHTYLVSARLGATDVLVPVEVAELPPWVAFRDPADPDAARRARALTSWRLPAAWDPLWLGEGGGKNTRLLNLMDDENDDNDGTPLSAANVPGVWGEGKEGHQP